MEESLAPSPGKSSLTWPGCREEEVEVRVWVEKILLLLG